MKSKQVGIIGYGRFGRFWASVLRPFHKVRVTDVNPVASPDFVSLEELCLKSEVIFLCVPISALEAALAQISGLLQAGTLVFDTCSVKMVPAELMEARLGAIEGLSLAASHPLFGPDSARAGVEGRPIATWFLSGNREGYEDWLSFFEELGLILVEIAPEEHDRLAAYSQGITHYVGRVLGELQLRSTPIDTQGFSILLSLIEQTCNDSPELFHDLQIYNPNTREMRLELESALDKVNAALRPERAAPDARIAGIQGAEGSFSEEACLAYIARQPEGFPECRIKYLYTTKNVLDALQRGEIDFGVFALQNARAGVVMESIKALSESRCEIVEMFDLVIDHCILHHPDVEFDAVDTIISHPQALAQCIGTLRNRYPDMNLTSGEGDLIDQALCARWISAGKLPKTTAVLASRGCAQKYNLVVHEEGLQDLGEDNLTSFIWAGGTAL